MAAIDQGRRLLVADRDQEAFEFLEEMVQRFPEDAEIRLLYASTLLAFRPVDADAEVAKAVELGQDDPVILVRAGNQLLGGGDVEAARYCAARANELVEPGFILEAGLIGLDGRLAAFDGNDGLAERKLRTAMAKDPDYPMFAINLARFLDSRNRRVEAIEVIDNALESCKMKDGLQELRDEILGTSAEDDRDQE